jgi:hypothetical protein
MQITWFVPEVFAKNWYFVQKKLAGAVPVWAEGYAERVFLAAPDIGATDPKRTTDKRGGT